MQSELAYRVGRAEATAYSAHVRLDDHGRVIMSLLRQRGKESGRSLGIWVQILGMVVTSAASIFGITLPERFLSLLEIFGRLFH